jgi:hypothetical protein
MSDAIIVAWTRTTIIRSSRIAPETRRFAATWS